MNKVLKIGILSIVCIYMVSRMPVFASDIIWANREPKHRKEMRSKSNGPSSSKSNGPDSNIAYSIVQEFNSDGTMTDEYKAKIEQVAKDCVLNGWFRAPGFGTLVVDNKETGKRTLVISLIFDSRTWEHVPNETEMLQEVSRTSVSLWEWGLCEHLDALYFAVQSWHDGLINDDYSKAFIVYNPKDIKVYSGQTIREWCEKYVTIK